MVVVVVIVVVVIIARSIDVFRRLSPSASRAKASSEGGRQKVDFDKVTRGITKEKKRCCVVEVFSISPW